MEKHRQYVYTTAQPSCVLTHKAYNLAIAIDSAYFVLHRVCYSSYHALHCRLSMHNQTLPLWKAWPLYCCLTIFTKPETILPSDNSNILVWIKQTQYIFVISIVWLLEICVMSPVLQACNIWCACTQSLQSDKHKICCHQNKINAITIPWTMPMSSMISCSFREQHMLIKGLCRSICVNTNYTLVRCVLTDA